MAVCTRVGTPAPLEGALEGQAVDHGGEHPHVVRGGPIHPFRAGRQAAKDVAAADDDAKLNAKGDHLPNFCRNGIHDLRIDS